MTEKSIAQSAESFKPFVQEIWRPRPGRRRTAVRSETEDARLCIRVPVSPDTENGTTETILEI